MENNETKLQVQEFSKEHSVEQRDETAQEIKTERQKYFDRKRSLTEQINKLTVEAQEKRVEADVAIREIRKLEILLAEHNASITSKVLNYLSIRKLRKEIGNKFGEQETLEQEFLEKQALIQDIQEQLLDKSELAHAKTMLGDFHSKQSEQWKAYEKEEKSRDVKNIAKENNVVFIHGTHPYMTTGDNSLLYAGTDWKKKLEILLSLQPTISASSIKAGDTPRHMRNRIGVILNGGRVQDGFMGDGGSVATGLKSRGNLARSLNSHNLSGIEAKIQETIGRGGGDSYNEFVVQNPSVAGFYVNMEYESHELPNTPPADKIAEHCRELGIPLYVIEKGVPYEAEYDEANKKLLPKQPLHPDQVIEREFQLPEIEKQRIVQNLFEDSPFKVRSQEITYMRSGVEGRRVYIELNSDKLKVLDDKSVVEFYGPRSHDEYSAENGRVYIKVEDKIIGNKDREKTPLEHRFGGHLKEGWINIGGMTHSLKSPVKTNADYLKAMSGSIDELRARVDEIQSREEKYPGENKLHAEWLNDLAYHLLGYADQAEFFSDEQNRDAAIAIAEKAVTRDQYHEMLKRRLGPQGQLKITREDIE